MKNNEQKIYEVDLFQPVQQYFLNEGYEVYGEVNDCDVVAKKGEELIIIELKLNLNAELLIQATNRQRLTQQVYIAVPKVKYKRNSKKWHDVCHLLKRLELGFIMVTFLNNSAQLEVIFPPQPFDRKRSFNRYKNKRQKLLNEMAGRQLNDNIGGCTKTKIMTAYKENCIRIAYLLKNHGPLSPKELRSLGTGEKTQAILSQNYYGWFTKESRGVYQLSENGIESLEEYPEVIKFFEDIP